MFEFLYRRIVNNKWLFLCLLLGALSTTAIISAIPMYSNAILQKVLIKDLEYAHVEEESSPSKYSILSSGEDQSDPNLLQNIQQIEAAADDLQLEYALPVKESVHQIRFNKQYIKREGDDSFNEEKFYVFPTAIKDLNSHVKMIYGKAPAAEPVDGVYEVIFSENAMKENDLIKDGVYTLDIFDIEANAYVESLKFKIVGVFTIEDVNALYWSGGRYESYYKNIVFDRKALDSLASNNKNVKLQDMENAYFFDYHNMKIERIPQVNATYLQQKRTLQNQPIPSKVEFQAITILNSYMARQTTLRLTLLMLLIPLIIIMCFYALIISNLIIKNDKNEIAVLKSRGAKRKQIFLLYVIECLVLSIVSLLAGPFLGLFLCKILGSSNGFLEFISRKAMLLYFTPEVYLYALVATLGFSLFVLIPAFKASHTSIVEYKRSLLSSNSKPFWKKFYLDLVVLGIALYGLNSFKSKEGVMGLSSAAGEVKIDPLVFFISTFFILGISLFFLRLYPMIISFIFKLGIKKWNPVLYFSLVNVGKADKNLQAIMLFIILTLSFGIINANQARTINSNVEDRIYYSNGADVVIEPYNNLKHISKNVPASLQFLTDGGGKPVVFIEPPFAMYEDIKGITSMTKVFKSDGATSLSSGNIEIKDLDVMGIVPNEFGNTVWFRSDLLPYHMNEYLNVMSSSPTAVLLSTNVKAEFDIKLGDKVSVYFGKIGIIECTVSGFIEHFPGYYPISAENKPQYLAVVNLNYMTNKLPVQPYEIWMKKEANVLDGSIHTAILDKNLNIDRADYAMQEIIDQKNDPMLLGTNGILTMCFIMTMLIASVGFIIFWALSIRERSLKFGIFRAIGMPMSHVNLIMISEQILVSGVAIVMGFVLGTVASQVVIPLLEIVYSSSGQVPAFKIVADPADYMKVLAITLVMVVSGLIVLWRMVKSIKVNQVIKLGEDS